MASGLLIAVYILVMGRLNVDRSVEDPVKVQTLAIANKLVSITEPHSGFGYISLCDSPAEERYAYSSSGSGQTHRSTSLNEAKASLHAAAMVANGLKSSIQEQLIIDDLDELDNAQRQLISKIFQTVSATANANESDASSSGASLHATVLKTLQEKDPTDLKTVSLKILLGRWSEKDSARRLRTIEMPESEMSEPFSDAGYFKADFPVPVARDRFVRLYPFASQVMLVDPKNFIEAAPGALPNAVLLEITYQPRGQSKTTVFKVRRVCALLGGTSPRAMPSCFMFRFPQGLPQTFGSPAAFLSKNAWSNTGIWQQASGGTVPGSGKFKLTIDPVLPKMPPGDALAIGLYHWVRHMRPAPDPFAVLKVFNQNFPPPPTRATSSDAYAAPVNSCLVADTGAREHSFAKNTAADSDSQKAIEQCFEYPGRLEEYPQSAMPLYVDRRGNLNMAGLKGFDTELISKYLSAVYGTNLAALESVATTKIVRRQCAIENRELDLRLSVKRQQLLALTRSASELSMQRNRSKTVGAEKIEEQIQKTNQNIEALKASVLAIENRKEQLRIINELARTVSLNADRSTSRTYELCATTFTMLRNGLHVFDPPVYGFLIGRKTVFLPIAAPVKESQFFEAAARISSDPTFDPGNLSPWFQKQLPILVPVKDLLTTTNATIQQRTVADIVSSVEVLDDMPPFTVLLDSRELQSVDSARMHVSSEYPFAGTPVSEDQAFFYGKSATISGAGKDVIWSVIMRDLVFHQGKGRLASAPSNTLWEKRFKPPLEGMSGLAVEFQLRRPLPRIEGMPAGAYITDPNKRLMTPQIPPVPVELM